MDATCVGRFGVAFGLWLALAACGERTADTTDAASGPAPIAQPATPPDRPAAEALGAPVADAAAQAQYQGQFEAFGAEPNWKLDVLDGWASFARTGLDPIGSIPSAPDVRAGGAFIEAGPLAITLKAETCQYEGGGQALPYTVSVYFEGVTYSGCGRRASGAAASGAGWAAVLPELLPAIDACLKRVNSKPGRVTIAYVVDNGQAIVRVLEADGGRTECSAAADGSIVTAFDPIGDRNVLQGEREPLFTRAPDAPPAGPCLTSEDVNDPAGQKLGALTRRTC